MKGPRKPVSQKHIPAYHGGGVIAKKGQRIKVTTLQGHQVGDFFAFVRDDPGELLSPGNTLGRLRRIYPEVGKPLYSNKFNPLLILEEDKVRVHDMLFYACSSALYQALGHSNHPNCQDNLRAVLSEFRFTPTELPRPLNLFQNTPVVDLEGRLEIRDSPAKPGDYVVLEALKDLLVVVTACSWDLGPLNGERPTDLMLEVYE